MDGERRGQRNGMLIGPCTERERSNGDLKAPDKY